MSDFLGEYLRCNDGVYTLAIHKPLWSPTIDVVFVGIAIDLPNT